MFCCIVVLICLDLVNVGFNAAFSNAAFMLHMPTQHFDDIKLKSVRDSHGKVSFAKLWLLDRARGNHISPI